ncbi:MAG: YIP1 family protein [Deltaproteobacteria bacterium]|nr:YIP1 family protein [Deltaproteobacteria bacterium]
MSSGGGVFRDGGDPLLPVGPPAAKRPSFLGDLFGVLFSPTAFWARPRPTGLPEAKPIWIHLAILIGIRSVAGFGGALLRDVGLGAAFGQLFSGLVAAFAMVWLFTAIVASLTAGTAGRATVRETFRYAAYGLTPLFAIGVLAVVPLPYVTPIADLVLMPYTFYVLALGVVPALGVAEKAAPGRVALICGSLLVLWSIMPTLIPLVVEALVR